MSVDMMDLDHDDPRIIDPEILKKELVISLPILSEADVQMMLNGAYFSREECSSDDDEEKEKPCLKRDQRRSNLLNNPDYGTILCFIDKFRSYINIKKYPLRILEDNLISEQEKLSHRFIDFHLALLKRVNSGRTIKADQFISTMAKFAYRFNYDDGNQLDERGYSKTSIDIKLRVLKNLLEKQFDYNQKLKTAVASKSAIEIRSKPFGRDRYGASYWLYTDTDCFFRLFRENIDRNCTWKSVAKDQTELENLIKILIADHVVRKKFPGWKFSYPSFNSLSTSHEFEEHYASNLFHCKNKNELSDGSSSSFVLFHSGLIKPDRVDFDPFVNLNRNLPPSTPVSPSMANGTEEKNDLDIPSDSESINSVEITGRRLRISSSVDTANDLYSLDFSQHSLSNNLENDVVETSIKTIEKKSTNNADEGDDDVQVIMLKPSLEQGVKRKLVEYDDSESQSEMEDNGKIDENSEDSHHSSVNKQSTTNADLPIALRRTKRGHKSVISELSSSPSSTSQSGVQSLRRRKSADNTWKSPSYLSKGNGRRERSNRRRRVGGGKKSMNGESSSTSDEQQRFNDDDDDDDDFSDDYLSNNTALDAFLNGDLLDEDDDDNDYISQRKARTVAQYQEKYQVSFKACTTCSQATRPDSLLLCEDCDDAYHIECLVPELFAVPFDNWYCPLCDHKRLCDGLIEKLHILIQDQYEYEMKRRLYVSKRRKRLTNVAVNVDRYVRQPGNDIQRKMIVSSDDEENEKITDSTNDDENFFGFRINTRKNSINDDDSVCEDKNKKNTRTINNGNSVNGCKGQKKNSSTNGEDSVFGNKKKTNSTNNERNEYGDKSKKKINLTSDDDSVYGTKAKKKMNSTSDEDSVYGSKQKKKSSSTTDDDSVYGSKKKINSTNDKDSAHGSKSKKKTNSTNNERTVYGDKSKKKINLTSDDDSVYGSKAKNKINSTSDEDSVYGSKQKKETNSTNRAYSGFIFNNDENRKPSSQEEEHEQTGKRSVRTCRRKAASYSFDDYDKKMKEAIINSGANKELVEVDSDDSGDILMRKKSSKKRARYELDEDFDASDSKHDREYVPSSSRRRTINEDGRSNAKDFEDNDNDDFGMSDDDSAWINRRKLSTSSASKKKSNATYSRTNNRKSTMKSDDDSMLSQIHMESFSPQVKVKSEPITEFDQNVIRPNVFDANEVVRNTSDTGPIVNHSFGKNPTTNNTLDNTPTIINTVNTATNAKNPSEKAPKRKRTSNKPRTANKPLSKNANVDNGLDENPVVENQTDKDEDTKKPKPRRARRPPAPKKKSLIQQENISDEDGAQLPAPKRRSLKKYRDSNDSPEEDDDDYDRLVHKRRLYTQGRNITRKKITDHIKELVGDEDDDEENEDAENEDADGAKKDNNNNTKPVKKNTQYDELQISDDDDDFPDEEEIIKTTGLKNLKKPAAPAKAPVVSAQYICSMPSYQFAMIDPTANFDLTCMPEPSITEPSDSNQANINNSQSATN
ncbi:unnamed protein product [Rotaria socialis]|uniref:PHD-type domain-containing protein n=1 Tax=Rotaria socialis TaxID=392032 RepID=A0A817U529_9BILA|nr:unnamed protein product [Rotaria socialis]CAF4494136.1 unnamed protein product [Rotaria socialis]